MLPWINFGVLIASSFLFSFFYVKSVGPAALEKRIGTSAYQKCSTYRLIASVLMIVVAVNYVLYTIGSLFLCHCPTPSHGLDGFPQPLPRAYRSHLCPGWSLIE